MSLASLLEREPTEEELRERWALARDAGALDERVLVLLDELERAGGQWRPGDDDRGLRALWRIAGGPAWWTGIDPGAGRPPGGRLVTLRVAVARATGAHWHRCWRCHGDEACRDGACALIEAISSDTHARASGRCCAACEAEDAALDALLARCRAGEAPHFHHCPACYEPAACRDRRCWLEPDLSSSAAAFGYHNICAACAAAGRSPG